VCPNCFQKQEVPPRGVPAYSGDRVLVLKFLYDFEEPERWDIIVFRNPNEPAQNYIKRLVALPGETVELSHGDVTIDGRVVQKTDKAQNALWMLVHDTHWVAHRPEWTPRWVPDRGAKADGIGFRLDAAADKETWLTYRHRDPDGHPCNILDFYAYNSAGNGSGAKTNACTDLSVSGEVTLADSASVFVVEIWAYKDRFRFELPAKGSGRPTRVYCNGKVLGEATDGVLDVGRAVSFRAADVDHKLMLLIGGRRVLSSFAGDTTPEGDPLYEPTPLSKDERRRMDGLAGGVRVGASGGPVALGYLRLDRDVYYTNERFRITDEPGYATEGHPLPLQPDEFFVLGDNSPNSLDCRLWALDRPVVPRRNLVGKAFFVYWPAAGRRTPLNIPLMPDWTGWRFVH
jgi:signal peptidase I